MTMNGTLSLSSGVRRDDFRSTNLMKSASAHDDRVSLAFETRVSWELHRTLATECPSTELPFLDPPSKLDGSRRAGEGRANEKEILTSSVPPVDDDEKEWPSALQRVRSRVC